MCKGNNERKKDTKKRTKKKKKLTCCQKLCRKIRRAMCRKIKRCIKKKVFGSPEPQLDDYDIAGYNLGSIRDKVFKNSKIKLGNEKKEKNDKAVGEKLSIITLFRKGNVKPYKEAITEEVDRYSLLSGIKNILGKQKTMDLRERSMFKNSSLKLEVSKNKLSKIFHDYLAKNKDSKLLRYLSANVLKRRFSVTGSRQIILDKMLKEYKEGKIKLSDFNKGSKIDFTNLNKDRFHKILQEYENKQKTNDKDLLKNVSVTNLNKMFSVSGSQQGILKKMVDDYKKGKLNASVLRQISNLDLKNINKDRFRKILQNYENSRKKVEFVRESKLQQVRSFVKSKIALYGKI